MVNRITLQFHGSFLQIDENADRGRPLPSFVPNVIRWFVVHFFKKANGEKDETSSIQISTIFSFLDIK